MPRVCPPVLCPAFLPSYPLTLRSRPQIVAVPADYKLGKLASGMDNFFRISDRGSSFWTEFSGGMTTFFSMWCVHSALSEMYAVADSPA